MDKQTKVRLILAGIYVGAAVCAVLADPLKKRSVKSDSEEDADKVTFNITDDAIPVMAFIYIKQLGKPQVISIPDVGEFIIKARESK
jgi:hypothetical protein